jgi:hypothetical protein
MSRPLTRAEEKLADLILAAVIAALIVAFLLYSNGALYES